MSKEFKSNCSRVIKDYKLWISYKFLVKETTFTLPPQSESEAAGELIISTY